MVRQRVGWVVIAIGYVALLALLALQPSYQASIWLGTAGAILAPWGIALVVCDRFNRWLTLVAGVATAALGYVAWAASHPVAL